MAVLKPGTRLRSAVCTTEVMIVRAPKGDVDVHCGGAPMLPMTEQRDESLSPAESHTGGSQMGKRYINADDDLEILCNKRGDGSLSVGDEAMQVKGSKPLPSSD